MMPYKIYRIVPMLAFCLLFSVSALAGVRLEAPDKAARGDAFLALATSDHPTEYVTFHWRGKAYNAKAQRAADAGGQWQAVILLPVPLDEKARRLELGVTSRNGPGRRYGSPAARKRRSWGLRCTTRTGRYKSLR